MRDVPKVGARRVGASKGESMTESEVWRGVIAILEEQRERVEPLWGICAALDRVDDDELGAMDEAWTRLGNWRRKTETHPDWNYIWPERPDWRSSMGEAGIPITRYLDRRIALCYRLLSDCQKEEA
jgi:hypothetical protein